METLQQNQTLTETKVERRREVRVKANHTALLKMPNAHPIEAWVIDVSASGARLRVPEPVSVGAAARIEAEQLLLFGTIKRCDPSNGAYEVGVVLARPLEMLSELHKLNASLLAESDHI